MAYSSEGRYDPTYELRAGAGIRQYVKLRIFGARTQWCLKSMRMPRQVVDVEGDQDADDSDQK